MILDAHVHICSRGALRTIKGDTELPGIVGARESTWKGLRKLAERNGIFKVLAIPYPFWKPSDPMANGYLMDAARRNRDLIIPIPLIGGGVFALERITDKIGGLKEHFYLCRDLPISTLAPEYDFLQSRNLPLIIHPHMNEVSHRIQLIRREFPHLQIILAHAGRRKPCSGEGVAETLNDLLSLSDLWFDTSTIRDPVAIKLLVRRVGAERVLFGSDYPFTCFDGEDVFEMESRAVLEAGLTEKETEQVLGLNFRSLFLKDVWIRRVARRDKDPLAALIRDIHPVERSYLAIERKMDQVHKAIRDERHMFVIEDKHSILGFLRQSDRPDNGALIEEIYLSPVYRGRGLASRLLLAIRDRFDWAEAKVLAKNLDSVRLFSKAGFRIAASTTAGKLHTWKWIR